MSPMHGAGRSDTGARAAARSQSRRPRRTERRRNRRSARSRPACRSCRAPRAYSMPVDALARLAADPAFAALFLDVDGVLAPIVDRPEDALVPEATRNELRRLATRYGLVACVTGRATET